jgi:4-amino-4-deoxy-L-arabinose transferase-like glycosyltransferase
VSEALSAVPGSARRHALLVALLLCLSAFVQLVTANRTVVDHPLRADAGEYFSYAWNLSRHGVYSIDPTWQRAPEATPPTPDAYRPPGYPLFLLALGDPEPTDAFVRKAVLAQALLGVLGVWLLFALARRFLPFPWALAAAVPAALSPHLAVIGSCLLSETLFGVLLLGATLATVRAAGSRHLGWCALAGVLWGAATLVRSTAGLFPPLLLAAALLPRLRAWRAPAALAFAVFLASLSPWVLRNQSPSVAKPASSLMVKALAHGSYPGFMYEDRPESFGYPYRFDPRADEVARDLPSVLAHIGGRFRAQPMRYLRWYLLGKPGYFLAWGHVQGWDVLVYPVIHSPWYEDRAFVLLRLLSQLAHWPLMVLGLLGAALAWTPRAASMLGSQRTLGLRLCSALVGYGVAFHVIVAPFPRYGLPFRPLLYALALFALYLAWEAISGRRNRAAN